MCGSSTSTHDKILGLLVGSAIGDALGAPSEMWPHQLIRQRFGNEIDLRVNELPTSPEGAWYENAPPGTTTDDTRWKQLVIDFLTTDPDHAADPSPYDFAHYILAVQQQHLKDADAIPPDDTDALKLNEMKRLWLEEWATVSQAYITRDTDTFTHALDKFYGGDLACAGLLYSPVLGLLYPGDADTAYTSTYALSLFDLGYARDISALAAAMVAEAMKPQASPSSILDVLSNVDPMGYSACRIIGRVSRTIYEEARSIVDQICIQAENNQRSEAEQRAEVYGLLDERTQQHAFHAGEIHLVNLTGLLYADFDFEKAMRFVVNYGRDNDTTAAVTGAILGAYHGIHKLPSHWVACVIKRNRELGIDLEAMADRLATVVCSHADVP